jgi:hypothetical protein
VTLAALLAGAGVLVLPIGASAEEDAPPVSPQSVVLTDADDPGNGDGSGSGSGNGDGATCEDPTAPECVEEPDPCVEDPTADGCDPCVDDPSGEGCETEPTPPTVTETVTETPDPDPEVIEVDDAVFTWSLSKQSNAASHEFGRHNFFSAGAVNPGGGGKRVTAENWQARKGNVEIQKQRRNGKYARATFAGLSTDAFNKPIGLDGPFSGHRVAISSGTGTVDPDADDAAISWKGTFTVIYYSGRTVFTLTDPVLEVDGGRGTLTATAGGWAADRANPELWTKVPAKKVTVADLGDVDVTEAGIVTSPDYLGVEVRGSVAQKTDDAKSSGSFPQSLISFLMPMGTDQFWYSTGLQTDWTKVAEPISVGWAGRVPEDDDPPTSDPTPKPTPTNPVTPTPTYGPDPVPTSTQQPLPVEVPPLDVAPVEAADDAPPWNSPVQVSAAAPNAQDGTVLASASRASTAYVAGGALLLAAAGLLLAPLRPRRT